MANVVIPKPLSSGSLEYPDAPQEGQPEIPEGFEPVSSSPEIPEGFEPVSKPVSPVQTAKPSPGIVDTIKGLGNRADDAITHSMEPKQGEGIGTAMGKTLGREVYSGAKAIPGMVTGLYDAVAAPESDEEKKVNKAQGFQEGDLGSKVSNAIGRVITDPIAVAGKWYKDAFTGKAGPDPLGDALSVAPEAIGSAAGNVIGGAAAHELAPAVKQGTLRALKADESNGMQGFRGNGMPKVQLVDPKLTKAAIEEGRASKVPTTVKSPAELAISEGRASKLPTTKKTPMGSALAPVERDATANPKNFPEYAGEDYDQSLPVERDATKLNEEHAGEDRGPMGSAIERDATMNPKNVPEYAGEERPMGSAIERDATKQNVEHAGEDYSPLERERDATLNKRNIPENAGENFGEKEITPEEVSKSRENVSKSPKDLLSKLIGKDDADQFSLPEDVTSETTPVEPEYKFPDTTVDNKANAQAKAELGLTDEKNLSQEQLDKISVRGQEIKNELNGKTAAGESKAEEVPKEEPYAGEERRGQDAKEYSGEERRRTKLVGSTETADKLKNGEVFRNIVDETPGAMDTINRDLASRSVNRTGNGKVEPTPAKLAEQKPAKTPLEAEPKEAMEAEPEAKSEDKEEPAIENATSNKGITDHLTEKAKIMEDSNEDPFRTRAFRNAAEAIKNLPEGQNIEDLIKNPKELAKVPGIGKSVASYLQDTFKTEGAKTLASSVSEEHLGDLSNDELKEQGKKYGLNPDDYDFKKREALRPGGSKHPVERRQFVRDLLDAMPEGDRVKLNKLAEDASKNAGIFSDKDMSSLGKAARAREVFSALGKKE